MKAIAIDQFTEEGEFVQTWPSMTIAGRELGLSHGNIIRVLDHSKRTEGGFKWKTSLNQKSIYRYDLKCEYTEEQRREFSRRIPKYMPVLYNLIKSYDFISQHEIDDYMQEAITIAWIQFYAYKASVDDGQRFGAWFKVTCRWGIFKYFNYLKKHKTSEYDSQQHDTEDEPDTSVARTLALYHCIEDLQEIERKIILAWMEERPCHETAASVGLSKNEYYHKVGQIRNILRDKLNYYYFGVQNTRIKSTGRRGNNPTPVEQWDLQGKFIAWYPTLVATKEKGFNPDAISHVITNRMRTHKGFFWKVSKFKEAVH